MRTDLLIAAALVVCATVSAEVTPGYDVGSGFSRGQYRYSTHSFEQEPEAASVMLRQAKVAVSGRHYKHGRKSLQIDFQAHGEFCMRDPEGMKLIGKSPWGGFKFWLYREKPSDAKLIVELGNAKGGTRWRFPVAQRFTGWRAVWCAAPADAQSVDPHAALEVLRIRSGSAQPETVWIDRMELGDYIYWARESDAQVAVNPKLGGGVAFLEKIHATPFPEKVPSATPEERASLRIIGQRLREWLTGPENAARDPRADAMREKLLAAVPPAIRQLDSFHIERHPDGHITGDPVFNVMHGGKPQIRELFDAGVLPLAMVYHDPGTPEKPNPYYHDRKILAKILLAFDHAHDQGWAAGSAMGTAYGVHLGLAGYQLSIFLMRNELAEANILEREIATSQYYAGFREIYAPKNYAPGFGSADGLRTVALFNLMAVVSMPESDLQVLLMKRYCDWLYATLSVSRGLNALIKPDGTLYHHWAPYWNGYGIHAVEMGARLGYWFRGTVFAFSPELRGNLKKSLLNARFAAQKYDFPVPLNGRWPMFADGLVPGIAGYAYTAMMTPEPDAELAAAFMRLYDLAYPAVRKKFSDVALGGNTFTSTIGNYTDIRHFADVFRNIPAEGDPQGNLALPYAGCSFHRRGKTLVTVKGNSRYIWDYESQACNQLGRNLSRGSITVYSGGSPVSLAGSGYQWQGWDWARIPGTTTIRKSFAEMDPLLIKDTSRHMTDQTAVGGFSVGENGGFMMRFHDTTYDRSFRFDQTVWFYGNMILSLGSGVRNTDGKSVTETTLFQRRLDSPEVPTVINGKSFTGLKTAFNGNSGKLELMDSQKIRYCIPDGAKVRVFRQKQDFPREKHGRETGGAGDYEVAVIDHGKAPKNGGWEYAILIEGEKTCPAYHVLRKDAVLHAVRFPDVTMLAVFAAGQVNCGKVLSVSAPALIAVRSRKDGGAVLTVAAPDFGANWRPELPEKQHFYAPETDFRNAPGSITVELAGTWKSANPGVTVSVQNGKTRITVPAVDGAAHEIALQP